MDKEIIELLRSMAGSAETLVIWYMVLQFVNNLVSWIGGAVCLYWFGRGVRFAAKTVNDSL
jgi:hypothetical protein